MTDDIHGIDVHTGKAMRVRVARTILAVEPEPLTESIYLSPG